MGILTFQLGTFGELFKFLSLQHALKREKRKAKAARQTKRNENKRRQPKIYASPAEAAR